MTKDEALKLALEALEVVTREMLALKDELAERGARPTTNVFHQRLWDSSFKAYTDHALPAATAIREALAQPEQEPSELDIWKSRALQAEAVVEKFMAQPEKEPVAYPPLPEPVADWVQRGSISTGGGSYGHEIKREGVYTTAQMHAYADAARALYNTPPQRTWVGLTREERFEIEKAMSKYYDYQHECKTVCLPEFARAIEAKLKEKNT